MKNSIKIASVFTLLSVLLSLPMTADAQNYHVYGDGIIEKNYSVDSTFMEAHIEFMEVEYTKLIHGFEKLNGYQINIKILELKIASLNVQRQDFIDYNINFDEYSVKNCIFLIRKKKELKEKQNIG